MKEIAVENLAERDQNFEEEEFQEEDFEGPDEEA